MRKSIYLLNTITNQEKEILHLIAYEYTAKQIASALFISEHTAITHRKNLIIKLDAQNTAGLIRRAFELGLLCVNMVQPPRPSNYNLRVVGQ